MPTKLRIVWHMKTINKSWAIRIMGILEDIESLRIQGAINIALAKLEYLERFSRTHGFGKEFLDEIDRVMKIRSTSVVSHNVLETLKKSPSLGTISQLRQELMAINSRVSPRLYEVFKNRERVAFMTHCHSSEVVEALKFLHSKGVDITAFVTETRPAEQGIITARELSEAGIKVEFIVDSADAFYMEKVDAAIVGSDSLREEGVVNKIGTKSMAIVAHEMRKPFIVLSSVWKIDRREEFSIEMRTGLEVREIESVSGRGRIEGEILNPAFDITPWRYVSILILEDRTLFRPGWADLGD